MHHPGPPRFVAVGDAVELAPRDPDPAATYRWSVERAPPGSSPRLDEGAVQEFRPEVPGLYRLSLAAPDGVHHMTVRCFPGPPASEQLSDAASGSANGGTRLHDAPGTETTTPREDRGRSYRPGTSDSDTGHGGGVGRPRLRLDGHVEADTVVVEADPRPHPEGRESAADLDVEFLLDDRDRVDATAASTEGRRLRVPLRAFDDRLRVHAVAVGAEGYSVPDSVEIRSDGEGGAELLRLHDPPGWATDAVYYEVYVRTFAPEAARGERFDAIADRLDYLAGLGVDALWLTPVLEHDGAPHGYNITDFFSLAADLGDESAYRRLVDRARDHGMRVLFDLVLNHSARDHPYFRDAYRSPDSEYRDWYDWQPSGEPATHFGWERIANFDFSSLSVRRHLLDFVDAWAPLVDGFRCDMAWAVPEGFWREVRDRVKSRDPEFLLLDETIPYVPDFHGLFDVHFDSTTYAAARSVGTGWAPAESLLDAIDRRREVGFPDHAGFLLYAENHDESRYLVECGRPAALAVAGAFCTLPGAPLVYAGQELGQRGRRDDIVWEPTDEDLTAHYRRLLSVRESMPALSADAALRRIDYEVREGDPDRVVAYGRVAPVAEPGAANSGPSGDTERAGAAVVVCNFGEPSATVSLAPETRPVDAATGDDVAAGGAVRVEDVVVLPAAPGEL